MIKHLFLFLILTLGVIACDPPQEPANADSPLIHIDSLLESLIPELVEAGTLQKSVIVGREEPETQAMEFTAEEWENELDFFLSANINRKSWAAEFSIDSSYQDDRLHITYRSENDRIPVKTCHIIQKPDGQLSYLKIAIRRSTALSSLERDLIYAFPDSIRIDNRESFVFLSPHELSIQYDWD